MDSGSGRLYSESIQSATLENIEQMNIEGESVTAEVEQPHYVQESKQMMSQELEHSQGKVRVLEELNKKISQTLKSEEMAWKNEKDGLLNLLSNCENNLNEKTEKVKELTEKLARAECAIEHLTNSKGILVEEASQREQEMRQLVDRLTEAEFALQEIVAKETSALKDSLLEKERMIINLKAQEAFKEKGHHEMDRMINELEEFRSTVDDLRNKLDQEKERFTALEEVRKRETELFTEQEIRWKNEREEILSKLNNLHDDLRLKEDHIQQLNDKISFAENAMKHMTESKSCLSDEISGFKTEMEQTYLKLKAAESCIESLERSKESDLRFSSDILEVKTREIDALHQELVQHQEQITSMALDIASLKDIQQMHASCEDLLKKKEEELLAIRMSQESSTCQLKTLQEEYNRNTENIIAELEKALEDKNAAEIQLRDVKAELERTSMALEKVKTSRAEAKAEIEKLMDTLTGLEEEKFMLMQENLQSRHLSQTCIGYSELHELHQKALVEWSEKESSWMMEKGNFLSQIETIEKELAKKECILEKTSSAFHTLKSSYERLEQKVLSSDEQKAQALVQLDEMNALLESKNQEYKDLESKLSFTSSALTAVLQEKECILKQTKEKMDALELEMLFKVEECEKLSFQGESLKEEVRMYRQKIDAMEQNIVHLKTALSEKTLEISHITESKDSMEAELLAVSAELRLAKDKIEVHKEELQDCILASDRKFQRTSELMQKKEAEFKELLISLEDKESIINELRKTEGTILEENGFLKQSVIALEEKVDLLSIEFNNEKVNAERLVRVVEEKDMIIALKAEELKNVQKIFENSTAAQDCIASYEQKIKELEESAIEATTCLQEKEERLIASEWAVQQLANEVSKAKNSLAQKEREEMLLQNRLSDLENNLKAKENEVVEIEGYVQKLKKKNSAKQSEVDKLGQAYERMQEKENLWKIERQTLVDEIEKINIALETKMVDLSVAEEQMNQKLEKENLMQGAIESLKLQLAGCSQLLEEEQSKNKLLLHDLEKTQNVETLSAKSLKEIESKLEESDKISKEKIQKLESNLTEVREELLSTFSDRLKLEADLLASLHEVASEKEKRVVLSQLVSAKESALKDMQYSFDLLQENFKEQKMLIDEKDTELKCYMDKERMLTENCSFAEARLQDMQTQLESMQEQNAKVTNKVHTMTTEISRKTEEIEQLKQVKNGLQIALQERETFVNKLQEEVENFSRVVCGKEADLSLARELLNNAEIDLKKARKDMHSQNEALKEALTRCRDLEGKMDRIKEKLEGEIVTLQTRLEEELREKQNIFELLNAEWKCTIKELNCELEAYCRNEASVEACIAALISTTKNIQSMLYEEDGLCALKALLHLEDMDLYDTSKSVETNDTNMEIADMIICDSREVVNEGNQNSKGSIMLHELQRQLKELQLGQYRRRNKENVILHNITDVLQKLLAKEKQNHELVDQIQFYEKGEAEWVQKIRSSFIEIEKDMKMAMTSSHPAGFPDLQVSQWQNDISQFRLQITASRHEIGQLCDRWKSIIESYRQHTLTAICSINKELGNNSTCQHKHGYTLPLATSLTKELDAEIMFLKHSVKAAIQQRETELANAVQKVENLQRIYQEKKGKENDRLGDILKLQHLLQESLQDLGQWDNTLAIDLYDEQGISAEEKGSEILSSIELKSAFFLAEKLRQQIKLIEEERTSQLTLLMNEAQCSRDQNKALAEELALVKLNLESTHVMESDLHNWKAKAETAAQEACSLRLEVRQKCGDLEDTQRCLKETKEEVLCLQSNLGVLNASKRSVDMKLEVAANEVSSLEKVVVNLKDEQILLETKLIECKELCSVLQKELCDLKDEKSSLERDLVEWKERTDKTSHDKTTLQFELSEARDTLKQLMDDKLKFHSEQNAVQIAMKRLEDEKAAFLSELTAVRHNMEQLENEKHLLQVELQDMNIKVQLSIEENIALRSKLEDIAGMQTSLEGELQEWKEAAFQTSHDKMTLLSELIAAKAGMVQVETDKSTVLSDLNATQHSLQELEEEKVNLLSQVSELENGRISMLSELNAARDAIEQLEDDKRQLQYKLDDIVVKIKSTTEENTALRSKVEVTTDLLKKLDAADRDRMHLQNLCQKLEAELVSVQSESGKKERNALSIIRASSSENRMRVESRLRAVYEALTNDDHHGELSTSSLPGRNDASLASNTVNLAIKDTENQKCNLDDYVALCDSLIRRHARLEKQLNNLTTSVLRQHQQGRESSPAIGQILTESGASQEEMQKDAIDMANERDNRKKIKRGELSSELGTSERMPLQPMLSQVGIVGRTPSPCAKRRRSNSSGSKSLKDQNESPPTSTPMPSQGLASCVQKALSFQGD